MTYRQRAILDDIAECSSEAELASLLSMPEYLAVQKLDAARRHANTPKDDPLSKVTKVPKKSKTGPQTQLHLVGFLCARCTPCRRWHKSR